MIRELAELGFFVGYMGVWNSAFYSFGLFQSISFRVKLLCYIQLVAMDASVLSAIRLHGPLVVLVNCHYG